MQWPIILAISLSILAVVVALWSVSRSIRYSASNVSIQSLAKLEAEMLEMADALDTLRVSVRKVRNRMNARHARDSKSRENGADGVPDLTSEAGRTQARMKLEAELAKEGRLNPREHLKRR
jgi:ABC-type multidrug transport system fused ATPase/permease subunit